MANYIYFNNAKPTPHGFRPIHTNLAIIAEQNQQLTAGQQLNLQADQGISQFAHSCDVKISATENTVEIIAGKEIKLICGGSYILLKADGIELGTGGKITMKAAHIDYLGASNMAAELPKFGKSDTSLKYVLNAGDSTRALAKRAYKIVLDDGQIIEGVTDALGKTDLAEKDQMRIAEIIIKTFEP